MAYRHSNDETGGAGQFLRNVGMLLTGGLLAAVAVGSFWAVKSSDRFLSAVNKFLDTTPPPPEVDVRSVVIQKVQDASELTTAVYTMQAVVPTSQDTQFGGMVVGTTKLLYIAHGEVQAGVDLSQVRQKNIQVQGDTIQVVLPPPRILNSKIDVNRSQVYDYNRGNFGLGPDVAPSLQTLAQQKALKTVVESACNDGILNKANDRARLVVTQLLSTAGYPRVVVETQTPAAGDCAAAENPTNPSANPAPAAPQP